MIPSHISPNKSTSNYTLQNIGYGLSEYNSVNMSKKNWCLFKNVFIFLYEKICGTHHNSSKENTKSMANNKRSDNNSIIEPDANWNAKGIAKNCNTCSKIYAQNGKRRSSQNCTHQKENCLLSSGTAPILGNNIAKDGFYNIVFQFSVQRKTGKTA
jgi:hypothetical protein